MHHGPEGGGGGSGFFRKRDTTGLLSDTLGLQDHVHPEITPNLTKRHLPSLWVEIRRVMTIINLEARLRSVHGRVRLRAGFIQDGVINRYQM